MKSEVYGKYNHVVLYHFIFFSLGLTHVFMAFQRLQYSPKILIKIRLWFYDGHLWCTKGKDSSEWAT